MEDIDYRFKNVRQVLEYYMENHGFNATSWADLANMTAVFIYVMGKKKLSDLRPEHFIAYNSGRRSGKFGKRKAKSDGTIRRELQHLKAAINFCLKAKVINPNDVPNIPMPSPPQPRDRWLTKDELARINAVMDANRLQPRVKTFIMIAKYTAARKSAIEKLQWDQVNFSTGMIDFTMHDEKRTKKRKAIVPMHPELRLYLEKIQQNAETDFVLENTRDIRAGLDAVATKARVRGLTPHVFRHTWATHASMNNVSMTEIARILGDTVATVERVYAKFQPDYLKSAIVQAAL